MPSHPQWPELLEEHAYLVQALSEAAHDLGALEHTCSLLEMLRVDLRTCTMQLADLEREKRESSPKHHDSRITSSASKIYHRVAASIHSDKDKHGLGEFGKQDQLLAIWTTKRTLSTEVKNLESKAQFLRRQKRHYDEFQRRLIALYTSVTEEKKPSSRDEDEAENDTRRAQHALYEVQKTLDRHKTFVALLRHGDYALVNAGRHLTLGVPGGNTGIDSAKRCAVQTSVVVEQARHLDPSFFEHEDAEVLKTGWLREVFQATSADESHPPSLLQALKPHHIALLSLISRAQTRVDDCDVTVRRAARQFSAARGRWDFLKRQVLVTCATAEAERDGEWTLLDEGLEKDGFARMRDIIAGLEAVIPIASMRRSSATSPPGSSGERQRVGQDEPVSRRSPLTSQPRAPRSPKQLPPSTLTPDLSSPPKSSPLSTPPFGSDLRTHAQNGSGDTKLRQSTPTGRQPPSADLSPRQLPSTEAIRQPKPIHHHRHPVLEHQYDQQWQSMSSLQHDGGPSPRPQGQVLPTSEHDEAIFRSRPQPQPGQPLLQGVQSSPPASMPMQPIQQTTKPLQPPAPNVPTPSADSRPQPSGSRQNIKSGAGEPSPMPRHIPQSQAIRPPFQVNMKPSHHSDSREPKPNMMSPPRNAQLGRPELQTPSGSSRSSPIPTQATMPTIPSTTSSSSQRPPVHGILKQASAPVTPQPSAADDADPWGLGVKVGTAAPSRPQPKLKTVFKLWRNAESLKNAESNASRTRVAPPPEEQSSLLLKKPNPRAAMQTLRFSEAVELIPRPAVDSDPYDDEEENELPPSPKRGSMIWLQSESQELKENSDDSSGDTSEIVRRLDAGEIPVNTAFIPNPSQSSVSSTSSSRLTDHSINSTLSLGTTPPSSVMSPLSSNWLGGAGSDPAQTMSPQDLQYTQPVIGRAKKDGVSYDDLDPTDTRSQNADKRRLQGPNVVPTDNPVVSAHNPSRRITSESTKSDRELLQTIFPSPAQTSIARHDLMFTF